MRKIMVGMVAVWMAMGVMAGVVVGTGMAQESGWTAAQKELWRREETYWKVFKAHDVAGYMALWDETFVGWPSYEKTPVNKKAVGDAPMRTVKSYSIEQKSAQVFGEMGVTYLQVRLVREVEGKDKESVIRLTHTWQKRNGEWVIVGGMSCTVKEDGTC